MAITNRKLRVFLCHASQDKPIVRELRSRLSNEGWIDPWLDEEKLSLGQHWSTAIEEALDSSDLVIIFLSKNSVQKEGFVQRELTYAWELSLEKPRNVIFLIPLRLDDCEVPRYLRSRQWGDYFGEKKEGIYRSLLHSLKQRHEQKLRLETEQTQSEKQEVTPKKVERKVSPEQEAILQRTLQKRLPTNSTKEEEKVKEESTDAEMSAMQKAWMEALEKSKNEKYKKGNQSRRS